MIALRPIRGQFGPMRVFIREGKKIPTQILKLLKVEELKKNGMICEDSESYEKIKLEEKSKDDEAIKKGEKERKKMIDTREKKRKEERKKQTPGTKKEVEEVTDK